MAVIVLVIAALAFFFGGHTTMALVVMLVALAISFLFGKPVIGDPAGVSGLPDGVTPEDVKRYRMEHEGASISEAVRALRK